MLSSSIGDTLKKYREISGLTVEEVSDYLIKQGLKGAPKTIYGWERGHSEPDALTLMTLCDLYGVSDIMSAFGYKKESPSYSELSESEGDLEEKVMGVYKILHDGLISIGFLKSGEKLNAKQAKLLILISELLREEFNDSNQ